MKKIVPFSLLLVCFIGFSQRPSALNNGKFFEENGNMLLYGGKNLEPFIINNLELKPEQFHYGIGKEAFPALLEPTFQSVSEANSTWKNEDRFLVAHKGNEVKAYSVKDLTKHEVINDYIDGEPIF
ncbi:MAG: DUF3179 domain-containing protein, partial [Flavobacteriia bacterium]|nr:DUF3179 domain-containing protein [Flavobacteriia bacterium]